MRFHRFDPPENQLPRPLAPAMTVAEFIQLADSPLFLRAQYGAHYRIFRGRA